MEEHYIERLTILANHLISKSDEIVNCDPLPIYFEGFEDAYGVVLVLYFFEWAFSDLPYLFLNWFYREGRSVHSAAGDIFGIVWSIVLFFGLTIDHFLHLFCSGLQQPHLYGGKLLTKISTGLDLGNNIIEFITKMK